jgi:hypothetical protein
MPLDTRTDGAGYRRIAGLYAGLRQHQEAAVVKPDMRLFNWDTADMATFEASRQQIIAEAQNQPKHSTLLDKLRAGQPVIVAWSTARPHLPRSSRQYWHALTPKSRPNTACIYEFGSGPG